MNPVTEDHPDLSPDRIYEILGHAYRRQTLCVLHSRPGAVDLEELATLVAARCRDEPVAEIEDGERDAVLVELHHNHVPRLRSAGLVAYDPGASGAVELVGDVEPLLPTLRSGGEELREYRVD
ncbi:DUF7344 domain-containing protein [Natronoarchaeum rubrum]|uniref:DUF7344 domain-containing protein n=1 Tax=Natronoarchaeum rubrum TaxID=755311 RepID=UPI0021137323|nr:hypothetical protein [Natronoarchaeum rubrum]